MKICSRQLPKDVDCRRCVQKFQRPNTSNDNDVQRSLMCAVLAANFGYLPKFGLLLTCAFLGKKQKHPPTERLELAADDADDDVTRRSRRADGTKPTCPGRWSPPPNDANVEDGSMSPATRRRRAVAVAASLSPTL